MRLLSLFCRAPDPPTTSRSRQSLSHPPTVRVPGNIRPPTGGAATPSLPHRPNALRPEPVTGVLIVDRVSLREPVEPLGTPDRPRVIEQTTSEFTLCGLPARWLRDGCASTRARPGRGASANGVKPDTPSGPETKFSTGAAPVAPALAVRRSTSPRRYTPSGRGTHNREGMLGRDPPAPTRDPALSR